MSSHFYISTYPLPLPPLLSTRSRRKCFPVSSPPWAFPWFSLMVCPLSNLPPPSGAFLKALTLLNAIVKWTQKLFQSPDNPTSPRNLAARFVNNPALSKSWSINLFMMKNNWVNYPNVSKCPGVYLHGRKKENSEWMIRCLSFSSWWFRAVKHSPPVCFFSVSLAPGAQICLSNASSLKTIFKKFRVSSLRKGWETLQILILNNKCPEVKFLLHIL